MNDSTNLPAVVAGGNTPLFGGLRPADLSIRIAEANEAVALAWITLDHPALDIKDLDEGRPAVLRMLAAASNSVSSLIALVTSADGDLMRDLAVSLKRAGDAVNKAAALVPALDGRGAGESLRTAQAWLNAAAQDIRWEVELAQAEAEFKVADENRRAQNLLSASRAWPRPVFKPAPDLPRDAGSVNVGVVLGVVALIFVALFCWALSGKADARSLDGPPVQAVKATSAKSKPRCAPAYRVAVPVHVTARSTADGRFHAAVWLQERYEKPRKVDGKWQYFRARLIGASVSDSPVVKVSGCIDPRKVDGLGGPIYLLLNDVVDDDQDAQGRIDRATVRVRFVEGRGWAVSK
jgi:hypothetical protein